MLFTTGFTDTSGVIWVRSTSSLGSDEGVFSDTVIESGMVRAAELVVTGNERAEVAKDRLPADALRNGRWARSVAVCDGFDVAVVGKPYCEEELLAMVWEGRTRARETGSRWEGEEEGVDVKGEWLPAAGKAGQVQSDGGLVFFTVRTSGESCRRFVPKY